MTVPSVHPCPTRTDASLENIIDLRGVVKTFKNAAGEFVVLKGIDLQIRPGEFVAVVGKSGSGKSTLLNMITGIDHPTSGQVIVGGTDIYHNMSESQRSRWRGCNLGIVFQFFQLMPMLSLLENVMLPMDFANMYDFDERTQRALELLSLVGLEGLAEKLPLAVSTGQQQSAAIARALATDPPLIVADEPTGNLDSHSADAIIALFHQLVDSGKTIMMVTHDPSVTARASRTVIIFDGQLIDETIVRALPLLRHRHMLEFSRLAERRTYPPGQTIISRQQQVDSLYMIARGEVEVVLQGRLRDDTVIARLGAGDFFGEIELLHGGRSIANVRASVDGPVELLVLPRDDFLRVIAESPITAEALGTIVQRRLEEHRAVDRRGVRLVGKKRSGGPR
ncbi:MAG: ATP-binding cassette domain-containing protein [Anaerolineales bacterium]|nr:ATP-binding cassette domain-containing protein [Anaerolineales bacterium]